MARAAGIVVLPSSLDEVSGEYAETFDAIVAFDVLEHLSISEISATLGACEKMLKRGGVFVARFPNGQSPFGVFLQRADVTHRTALSTSIMNQLLAGSSLRIIFAGMPHPRGGGLLRRMRTLLKRGIRSVSDFIICTIYDVEKPLDTNVVVICEKGRPL